MASKKDLDMAIDPLAAAVQQLKSEVSSLSTRLDLGPEISRLNTITADIQSIITLIQAL